MRIRFIFLFFALVVVNTTAFAKEEKFYQVVGTGVNLREEPNTRSKVLVQLPIGNFVRLEKKGQKDVINNIEGQWLYIRAGLNNPVTNKPFYGWVFDYYLIRLDIPIGSSIFEKVVSNPSVKIAKQIGNKSFFRP
mgnify:CR=1 FL=1